MREEKKRKRKENVRQQEHGLCTGGALRPVDLRYGRPIVDLFVLPT